MIWDSFLNILTFFQTSSNDLVLYLAFYLTIIPKITFQYRTRSQFLKYHAKKRANLTATI